MSSIFKRKNPNEIVEAFNLIAPKYDFVNDLMTFGMHRKWRKALCKKALNHTHEQGSILDIATGTGDVIYKMNQMRPDIKYTGIDPSSEMLQIAKQKLNVENSSSNNISLIMSEASHLPFSDSCFDTITISWGIRNIHPFLESLHEIYRVLKPNGNIFILESGLPQKKVNRKLYQGYAKVLPLIGGFISGFQPAYEYYIESVSKFPAGNAFLEKLIETQFIKTSFTTFGSGTIYLYSAKKR